AYTLPSTDGTAGPAITTDGAGNLAFSTVDSDSALRIALRVKNVSGSTLSAGTLVRVAPSASPPSGNVLEVNIADNSSASTMPAIGILTSSLANEAEGDAVAFGRASGFSTSGYTEGDPIWVGSNGAFVGTKPTGSDLIQKVGQIIKVDSSNGSIEVFGAGRTNDVPNLSVGKIWVGTTTNTAESTLVEIDETNNILTVGGKIYYSNVFSQESDLPSATTYHGMFAHVHGTGYAYYAHAGAWVKLAKHSELVAAANDATITLTAGTGLSGGGDFTTDQATNETITVNLADTAVTPGTYGDADNTPQITIDQQGRVTSATTVATAGAGGGGGSASELSIERDVFTATADQTAFTITSSITSGSNTQVYIDGVYQAKSNYTTSGSTITFSTGVPLGAEVEVVHFISVLSKVYTDTFTGDDSTVAYTASKDVTDENVTQVYIDGVYQAKDNYTTSGTTITFSTAPPDGSAIEVVHFTAAEYSTLNSNQFTGTGSQTDFTLTQAVDADKSFVFIQGIYQEKSTYSISGTTLTFTTAPLSGYTIEVITVGSVSIFNDTLFLDNFTGNGTLTDYTLSTTPASENAIDVYLNGIYQNKDTFTLSGNTLTFSTAPTSGTAIEVKSTGGLNNVVTSSGGGISWQTTPKTANFTAVAGEGYFVNTTSGGVTVTLPTSPSAGDEISIVDYAGTADTNNITITSSDNINGSSNDVKIDYERGGVSMVYVDATQGWIAYNAANETATGLIDNPPSFSVDYLVVAGAGAGGFNYGGGGGAGGLRTSYGSTSGGGASAESSLTLVSGTNYSLTIGAGGSAPTASNTDPTTYSGSSSSFYTITTVGGGGGGDGSYWDNNSVGGVTGGSGGGGPVPASGSTTGGAGTTDQGYAGGAGSRLHTGGGGGAAGIGEAGGVDGTNYGGDGGNGLAVDILSTTNATTASVGEVSGGNTFFAGGGGGMGWAAIGTGGVGGGGNGAYLSTTASQDGSANTGGGGGGNDTTTTNGAGGSGVVILRYPSSKTITVGSGITEASGSPFTEGTDKVSVFTAGTGTISFS
uniref:beta strand repeat-containing protein n=1 Tax=uncultured Polaribacter sp. TaxID=174711 RepID=UPI00259B5D28